MKIEVFADGSATTASKPGGYGWVLVVDGIKHSEGNGYLEKSTNNDAEMFGCIHGLRAALEFVLKEATLSPYCEEHDVILLSDSQIALGWANGTYNFKQVHKYKYFEILRELVRRLNVKTQWVRGHSGNEHNERCDVLANLGRRKLGPNDKLPSKPSKRAKKSDIPEMGKNLPKKSKSGIGKKTENVFNIWFNGQLKLIDLRNNICETYDSEIHGPRNSRIEYKS